MSGARSWAWLRVTAVECDHDRDHDRGRLTVCGESLRTPMGCRECGVIAHGRGRCDVGLGSCPG